MRIQKKHLVVPVALLVLALAWPTSAWAQDPDAAWRAGYDAFQNGNYQGCVDQMRTALQAGGEAYERWGWLHLTLGVCLAARNQRDEAISELQTAKELVSEDSERLEVNLNLAQTYVARGNSGDYDRAIAAANDAGQYGGNAAQQGVLNKTLGQAYYFKEDWSNAAEHLAAAAETRNNDEDVAQKLARAHYELGNIQQAKQWFETTVRLNSDSKTARVYLGRIALDQRDWDQAIQSLQRAVQADPQDMQVRNMLGRAYLGAKQYDQAVQQLQQVVQGRPNDGNARYNLGQAYQADGDDGRAIEQYTEALNYLPAGSNIRAAALYDLGFVYEKVGRYEDALQAFEDSAAIVEDAKVAEAIERVKERIRRQKESGRP